MIFNVQRLISEASHITTLYPGDIVMTGTPEGVGQVDNGAILKAGIKGLESSECEFTVISI
jgi:2-keto-4-pentenoate hydratase/2-oxohepta-3-ene-1,7-dioic acid hydratase in catechol pathway